MAQPFDNMASINKVNHYAMKKLAIIFIGLFATACNNDDDSDAIFCTLEYRPPIVVSVTDAVSGTVLTDGVVVLAVSGAVSVNLPLEGEQFTGAPAANTYVISVSKQDYETYTSSEQTQEFNECGVITNNISVQLTPLTD